MFRVVPIAIAAALWPLTLPAAPPPATPSSNFNPAVSVILNGTYGRFSQDPAGYNLPGFALGEETGPGERGLSLGESELVMSANADDLFLGYLTVALTPGNEAAVEEAFIQTIGLPHGLTLRAGRFLSGIGYMNEQHPHVWDFVDTALPYRALLANQYGDDGVQLRWLAPTDLFIEIGAEAFRGDSFPAAGAAKQGSGGSSVFAHGGGDVGVSHSWRAGVSRLMTQAVARASHDLIARDTLEFTGDTAVNIIDFVWKWAPDGNATVRNFKLQAEYFRREEEGAYSTVSGSLTGELYSAAQSGWYLQGVYQFMPRWRAGLRYDALRADAVTAAFGGTVLDPAGHDPRRTSAMLDFSNSEFSRLRLQYNRDESRRDTDNQYFLQYIVSLGAHGAHRF